jgi:hypothetical protein
MAPAKKRAVKRVKTAKKKNKPAAKKTSSDTAKTSTSSEQWTFPRYTLEESIRLIQGIEEKYAGNPTEAKLLPPLVGLKKVYDWRFTRLLISASQYGISTGTGTTATVELTSIGMDIVAPDSPEKRKSALLKAFTSVDDFAKVMNFYKGKKIPEDEFFANTLTRIFEIPKERVSTFIKIFTENLKYIRAFQTGADGDKIIGVMDESIKPRKEDEIAKKKEVDTTIREYLDTCFVLMPFGSKFDTYYKGVFMPAIKEAGFEPLRADDLFGSGMVIEQIWEQIKKAKVLLAELSGKNANVFYELGLAHAIGQPAVIVSSNIEDVPFDLRHLRVITYNVDDPFWGDQLGKSIIEFLKNTKADPEKSIPQTFRIIEEETE